MIIQSMLPEFDHEMRTTRALLERVPDGREAWKPHEKSRTLGELAMHIASTPQWGSRIARNTVFSAQRPNGAGAQSGRASDTAERLAVFDRAVQDARADLEAISDQAAMQPFTFVVDGKTQFTMPRAAALRTMLLSHLIHHRGQLSVYLRLNDVALPSIYGPTADMT